MIYFDTSALIKIFVLEKGSEQALRLAQDHFPLATAAIAYAEIYLDSIEESGRGTSLPNNIQN